MDISRLNDRPEIASDSKLLHAYTQLGALLEELRLRDLPLGVLALINQEVEALNEVRFAGNGSGFAKLVKQAQGRILKVIERELKIVPKDHYRMLWMVLGMTTFGLPIGMAIGMALGNIAFLGVGLPMGFGIGMAVGVGMDNKAMREGRQLNFTGR